MFAPNLPACHFNHGRQENFIYDPIKKYLYYFDGVLKCQLHTSTRVPFCGDDFVHKEVEIAEPFLPVYAYNGCAFFSNMKIYEDCQYFEKCLPSGYIVSFEKFVAHIGNDNKCTIYDTMEKKQVSEFSTTEKFHSMTAKYLLSNNKVFDFNGRHIMGMDKISFVYDEFMFCEDDSELIKVQKSIIQNLNSHDAVDLRLLFIDYYFRAYLAEKKVKCIECKDVRATVKYIPGSKYCIVNYTLATKCPRSAILDLTTLKFVAMFKLVLSYIPNNTICFKYKTKTVYYHVTKDKLNTFSIHPDAQRMVHDTGKTHAAFTFGQSTGGGLFGSSSDPPKFGTGLFGSASDPPTFRTGLFGAKPPDPPKNPFTKHSSHPFGGFTFNLNDPPEFFATFNTQNGENLFTDGKFFSQAPPPKRPVTRLQDAYTTLGIPSTSTKKQVRDRYLQLAKESHPDKDPEKKNDSEKFIEIQKAYDRIVN
jgi:hypothetical protein